MAQSAGHPIRRTSEHIPFRATAPATYHNRFPHPHAHVPDRQIVIAGSTFHDAAGLRGFRLIVCTTIALHNRPLQVVKPDPGLATGRLLRIAQKQVSGNHLLLAAVGVDSATPVVRADIVADHVMMVAAVRHPADPVLKVL